MTPDEVENLAYNSDMLLNWDIKCVRQPEDDAVFIGVFLYRHGTPLDYNPIKGLAYYHNHILPKEITKITKHLQDMYGGKEIKKGDRVLLEGSRQFYDPRSIARLARSISDTFDMVPVITLEFEGLDQEQMRDAGLPDAKLLPIPGK